MSSIPCQMCGAVLSLSLSFDIAMTTYPPSKADVSISIKTSKSPSQVRRLRRATNFRKSIEWGRTNCMNPR